MTGVTSIRVNKGRKMSNIKIGVVLVNYHTVQRIIDIALKYSYFSNIYKIVIVNNDTADEEMKILNKLNSPKINIIFQSENLGYSKGNNIGIKYLIKESNPEYIVISNSDIEIDEKTIQGIIEMLEEFPEFGAMAPRMLDGYGNITPLRFLETSYKRLFLSCFIKDLDKKTEKFIKNYEANIKLQSSLPGSFFICRTQALIDCNMFDTSIFLYGEEEILGRRMQNAGYKLGVVNDLYYQHNHIYSKESLSSIIRHKNLDFISEQYFFKKYLGASRFQMNYVRFFEKLYMCKHVAGHIIKYLTKS